MYPPASATYTHPPRIFFFIETYADDKCRFSADYPGFLASDDAPQVDAFKKAPALPRMYEKGIETAYTRFVEQHPEYSLSRAKFFDDLKVWRKDASFYVYFGMRLGMGALLWLSPLILPGQLWGASKGGDGDGTGSLEGAFRRLEGIG